MARATAQAPATPKPKRALLRAAATLSPRLAAHLSPAPSEVAALAARARPLRRPENPEVVFLIPLVGRHQVEDWAGVSERLGRTVESLRRQTAPRWRALICGQDRPDAWPDESRLQFIPFEDPRPGNDKWRKLACLAQALPAQGVAQGYAMPFDADDLLAPWAVEEMLTRRTLGGYLVTRGYVHDAQTGGWAEARPQSLAEPGQKAFWKLCGSCAAFAFDLRSEAADAADAADAALIGAITQHEHRMFPYLAGLARRPLSPLRPGAALYILNHGANFGARRGRVDFKTRFVTRFGIDDVGETARLAEAFGV